MLTDGGHAHRDEDAALRVLGHIGEVQEGRQAAGQPVGADVKDVHQDLAVRKLQRLLLEHAALAPRRRQRAWNPCRRSSE